MKNRSAISGPAPAQPEVLATEAAAHAQLVNSSHPRPDPSCPHSEASGSSPAHPALNALTRLLARQISRAGGADD